MFHASFALFENAIISLTPNAIPIVDAIPLRETFIPSSKDAIFLIPFLKPLVFIFVSKFRKPSTATTSPHFM